MEGVNHGSSTGMGIEMTVHKHTFQWCSGLCCSIGLVWEELGDGSGSVCWVCVRSGLGKI